MKIKFLLILLLISIVSFCFSAEEETNSLVQSFKSLEVSTLNFEELSKKTEVGALSDVLNRETEKGSFLCLDSIFSTSHYLYPYAEQVAYVNGQLCHIGNYTHTVIYTNLDGPYYGLQTTMTYNGVVLMVNQSYDLEYAYGGAILHHFYTDCEIITGSTQVIRFY